jgi:cholestenol delta-isomerase
METFINATLTPHPFYPVEAKIVGYLANEASVSQLLGTFAAGCIVVLGTTLALIKGHNPTLSTTEKAAILWNVLSGTIHLFFEGYFAFNHASLPAMQDIFGQMWKEYSYADSRYLTSDPFVLCMEAITAVFWGPLSFVVALLITAQHPLRHPLQALVALGQIYGDILYYATSMFDHYHRGLTYCRPEAYYFWFYYFFLNFIWIVIPGALLYNSIKATGRAFKALEKKEKAQLAHGMYKKSS